MFSKSVSPLKKILQSRKFQFSTLSSDVILKDEHFETYYRGNLLKINYSEVRDNPACQEVFFQDNYFQDENVPSAEAVPELVMRKNDMLNFDWNDGTWSSVNLTKLIEAKLDHFDENDSNFENSDAFYDENLENRDSHDPLNLQEFEDSELSKIFSDLSETGISKTNFGLRSTLEKVAFFKEASYYCRTHKNVQDALPSDHNGLAILTANKNIKIQLINTIQFTKKIFKNRHPKYFKKLATQPSLVYAKSYPSPGWLKCITMDVDGEIDEIRLGNVDKMVVGDYTQQAYDCFEYEMQNDEIDDDDESYVEEIVLEAGSTVLMDCTTWKLKQGEENFDQDLKVRSCLLTNDNWKSTARMLKTSQDN